MMEVMLTGAWRLLRMFAGLTIPITAGIAGYGVASNQIHPIVVGVLCALCAGGFMGMLMDHDNEIASIQRRLGIRYMRHPGDPDF